MYRRDVDVSLAKEGNMGGLLSPAAGESRFVVKEEGRSGYAYGMGKRVIAEQEEEIVQQLRQSHTRRVMNGGPLVPPIIRSPR